MLQSTLNNRQVGFSTKGSDQDRFCASPFLECDFSEVLEIFTLQTRDPKTSYFTQLIVERMLMATWKCLNCRHLKMFS